MFKNNSTIFSVFVILLTVLLFGVAVNGADTDRFGGTLRIAATGEPPTLDNMVYGSSPVGEFSKHIFETPFAFNKEYEPIPYLVESYNFQEDGKILEMKLREGVLFHNGKEMTSSDFVASMKRWGNYSSKGKDAFKYINKVVKVDSYTVKVHFDEPFSPILAYLARSRHACTILPEEIAEKYGASPIDKSDYIGTGPYKFEEWVANNYIKISRFKDYVARDEPADGYGGKRVAYFDEIRLIPVPELGTRISGLEVGEFDFVTRISSDHFNQIGRTPAAEPFKYVFPGYNLVYFNLEEGRANIELRRAILAALDMEPILISTYGDPEFYNATGTYYPEGTLWYTENGTDLYDQANSEKAKELMEAAGYDGDELRYLSTKEFSNHYDQSVIVIDQLEKVGINIDFKLHDWATLRQKIENPEEWDLFFTRSIIEPEPLTLSLFAYPGWWDSDGKNKYMDILSKETDAQVRADAWEELQNLMYEEVPWILTGKHFFTGAISTELEALDPKFSWRANSWCFWNAWFGDK